MKANDIAEQIAEFTSAFRVWSTRDGSGPAWTFESMDSPEQAERDRNTDTAKATLREIGPGLADILYREDKSAGVSMRKMLRYVEDGITHEADDLWPDVDAAMQCLRGTGTEDTRPADVRVAEYYKQKMSEGWKVEDFNRDQIAKELGYASGATVSNTPTWKEIASAKKRLKKASTTEQRSSDAIGREEWDKVAKIQKTDEQNQHQYPE